MKDFLIRRIEQMIASLDFSSQLSKPIVFLSSQLTRTSDGGVLELVIDDRRYLISVEECEDHEEAPARKPH